MDWQAAFNLLWLVTAAAVSWVINKLSGGLKSLEDDMKSLPDIYARRDDVKDGFARVEKTLERIEHKLDSKADK